MSSSNDVMSPDASPGKLNRKSGVRRVNNWPMYLIGGAAMVFLLIMLLVAADRADQQDQPEDTKTEKAGNSSVFAQQINGMDQDGIIPSKAEPPVLPTLDDTPVPQPSGLQVVRPSNLDAPPLPPRELPPNVDAEEVERIRRMKAQQFQEAVRAHSTVRVDAPRSAGSSAGAAGDPVSQQDALARIAAARQRLQEESRNDPTAAYKARMAELRAIGSGGGGVGHAEQGDSPFLLTASANGGKDYNQFDSAGDSDRWRMEAAVQAPRSPYELRAGYVIPATMISGINSDLPGQIIAQISQAVYDTSTGKHVLLPQGSRLVGSYSSSVDYGQSRVLVAWQRIIFPDGKAMDIGSMPGSDSAGYSGFNDKVNNHYVRVFGSALLMSGIVAGVSLSQDRGSSNESDRESASSAMSEALGQQLGQVTAQMIAKNLNIAPTLEIRPGYRFNVMVTKDLTFSKPYQSFDY